MRWPVVALVLATAAAASAHPRPSPELLRAVRALRALPAPPHPLPQIALAPEGGVLVLRAEADDLTPLAWDDAEVFTADLLTVARAVHAALPEAPVDVVVVLTEVEAPRGSAYLPLANDVRGLGYGHLGLAPDEVFRTGAAPWIDGVIHLGPVARFTGPAGAAEARYQFLHELGHRWGVYARFQRSDGPPTDAWLGRDCAHWSFFTHSERSALEGNRWRSTPTGWVAEPDTDWGYNDFDRYLMGFAPHDAVAPLFFLPEAGGWDCDQPRRDDVPNPAWQPPVGRGGGPGVAEGPAETVTIEQVRAAEGPRSPAWPASQQVWSVVFVIVAASADPPVAEADALRRMLTATWMAAATQPGLAGPLLISHPSGAPDVPQPDLGGLDHGLPDEGAPDSGAPDLGPDVGQRDVGPPPIGVADAGAPLDARADGTTPGADGGCGAAPAGGPGPWSWAGVGGLALGLGRRRRRRRA